MTNSGPGIDTIHISTAYSIIAFQLIRVILVVNYRHMWVVNFMSLGDERSCNATKNFAIKALRGTAPDMGCRVVHQQARSYYHLIS